MDDVNTSLLNLAEVQMLETTGAPMLTAEEQDYVKTKTESNIALITKAFDLVKKSKHLPDFKIDLTVRQFYYMMESIRRIGPTVSVNCIIAAPEAWATIITNSDFISYVYQNSKYTDVLSGDFGMMFGVPIISDSMFHPQRRMLDPNLLILAYVKDGEVIEFRAANV